MTGYEACPICGNSHEGSACPKQSFADGERIVKQAMEKLSDASKGDFMKAYYRIDLSDNHLRKIVSESNSDASFAGAFVIPLIDALLTTRRELAEMKEALRKVCDLCDTADFSSGVCAFGVDEGAESARQILSEARKLLPLPPAPEGK